MYSAVIGFISNFVLNYWLVPKLGVLGVAIGSSIGSVLSLFFVLAGVYRQVGLTLREVLIAVVSWFGWLIVCFGISSGSVVFSFVGIILLGLMARLQWLLLGPTTVSIKAK